MDSTGFEPVSPSTSSCSALYILDVPQFPVLSPWPRKAETGLPIRLGVIELRLHYRMYIAIYEWWCLRILRTYVDNPRHYRCYLHIVVLLLHLGIQRRTPVQGRFVCSGHCFCWSLLFTPYYGMRSGLGSDQGPRWVISPVSRLIGQMDARDLERVFAPDN